jgi:hypothetical protein
MSSEQHSQTDNPPLYERPPGYRSYVLRFWQERSDQPPLTVWRFSLEDPSTDERYGFPNLQTLVEWLRAEMAKQQQSGDDLAP